MKGVYIMKKNKHIRVFVIVFSLLILFTLPCVTFATSVSDIRLGNVDNSLDNIQQMRPDGQGHYDSNDNSARKSHRDKGWKHHQKSPAATPIPPAAWLLGTGLVGLIGIKRKLKK